MNLEKVMGQDCPACGCNATNLVEAGGGTNPWARYRCDHCGHVFMITERKDTVVQYLQKRIPICPLHGEQMRQNGGDRTGRTLYYICRVDGCGLTGKGSTSRVS